MLPLRHDDIVKNKGVIGRVLDKVGGWIRLILADKNSKNLLGILILNLSFAFVELIYGVWTNSLGMRISLFSEKFFTFLSFEGLISDSFHMFFDCTGLLAGLFATVITKVRVTLLISI